MFVCERCHDRDLEATKCNYTYKIHTQVRGKGIECKCEVCGKIDKCIFCDSYDHEIVTRFHIKRYAEIKRKEKEASNAGMCAVS